MAKICELNDGSIGILKEEIKETTIGKILSAFSLSKSCPYDLLIRKSELVGEQIKRKPNYNGLDALLSTFVSKLKTNFPNANLSVLNANLNSLIIRNYAKKSDDLLTLLAMDTKKYNAYYDIAHNKIVLKEFSLSPVFHELLHAASTKRFDDYTVSGFNQIDDFTDRAIGMGLNEGYTQALANKLSKERYTGIYELPIMCSIIIEKIVGKDEMIKYYFNADLLGLIQNLSSKIGLEHALNIMLNLDDYLITYHKQGLTDEISEIVNDLKKEMIEILSKSNIPKEILEAYEVRFSGFANFNRGEQHDKIITSKK